MVRIKEGSIKEEEEEEEEASICPLFWLCLSVCLSLCLALRKMCVCISDLGSACPCMFVCMYVICMHVFVYLLFEFG